MQRRPRLLQAALATKIAPLKKNSRHQRPAEQIEQIARQPLGMKGSAIGARKTNSIAETDRHHQCR
jgi:hypothetical protein